MRTNNIFLSYDNLSLLDIITAILQFPKLHFGNLQNSESL